MPTSSPDFSAAPSALGYLYQVRYALVLLLEAKDADSVISIEKLDDVAFEEGGDPTQLLQFKHHISHRAVMTDSSADLWKTLRIWATKVRDGSLDLSKVILSIVTTSPAPAGSAAHLLRDSVDRDEVSALTKLQKAGAASENKTVKQAWADFDALSREAQEALLSRIRVLDEAPDIQRARNLLEMTLRYSTRPQFLAGLCDRLEGWWFRRAVEHLKDPATYSGISLREAQLEITDLSEQFRLDNLPVDFPIELDVDESRLPPDERLFVEQLRLVLVSNERIKKAISDYWRAFQQRSRWVREDLILDKDLEEYEDRLLREWEELFLIMKEKLTEGADHAVEGRNLYNRIVIEGKHIAIRPSFPNPFVMRGSFHMLANTLRVGWHPQFRERFANVINKAMRAAS
ncbi:MAG TPA: ABC-three component system protein [Chthoniobacteraceae bacterium]|jgi:hypothetical protein|nr:ABC-three component system protein [Chthoniobacteraceae bacterium]